MRRLLGGCWLYLPTTRLLNQRPMSKRPFLVAAVGLVALTMLSCSWEHKAPEQLAEDTVLDQPGNQPANEGVDFVVIKRVVTSGDERVQTFCNAIAIFFAFLAVIAPLVTVNSRRPRARYALLCAVGPPASRGP